MRGSFYNNYLLTVLMVIFAFNQVEALAFGLAMQDIKRDLGLSDTQLGLLTGIAFAAFYSVMGIPLARWADRGNRVVIIVITTVLWCGAVALCGLAAGFSQLVMIRIFVAVGEAGCVSPSHSLIADHFTRAERAKAVSIFMMGGPLSVVVGNFLAGWLNELYGWRSLFMMLAVPGLFLAGLAWLTLRDPRFTPKVWSETAPEPPRSVAPCGSQPNLLQVCVSLWSNVTFRHLMIYFSVASFFGYGIARWLPAFFMRTYGLSSGELGTMFAVVLGTCGLLGTYCGGIVASRLAVNKEALQLKAMAVAYCGLGTISSLTYVSPTHWWALGWMGLAVLGGCMASGPMFAIIQSVVPDRVRATAIALIYLFANLIGMGFGPLVAGVLSDALHPLFGEDSLRYSLLGLCPGYLWSAWHLWQANKTVARDLQAAQAERETMAREGTSRHKAVMREAQLLEGP